MRNFIVSVVFLGLCLALIGLNRSMLAQAALQRWCTGKDLLCEASVTQLSLERLALEDVTVSSATGKPFEAKAIVVELGWSGLFAPTARHVELDAPIVRLAYDGTHLTAYGLETVRPAGGGGGALPTFDIADAVLVLSTPAGELTGSAELSGDLRGDFQANARLDPANLATAGDRFSLKAFELAANVSGTGIEASVRIDVPALRIGDTELDAVDAHLQASSDAGGLSLVWSADVAGATYGATRVTELVASGVSHFASMPQPSLSGLRTELDRVDAEIRTAAVQSGELSVGSARVELALGRHQGGVFTGPVAASLTDLRDPLGTAQAATFAGRIDGDAVAGEGQLAGRIVLVDAALAQARRDAFLAAVKAPSPLRAHADTLRQSLNRAFGAFDAEAALTLTVSGEADWSLDSTQPASLSAASGLEATISPHDGARWLDLSGRGTALKAGITLAGGGAPSLTVSQLDLTRAASGLRVETGPVRLLPWSRDGLSIAADLAGLRYERLETGANFALTGAVEVDGSLPGVAVERTRLVGDIAGSLKDGTIRVELPSGDCLGFTSAGITAGVLRIGTLDNRLCPPGGVLLSGQAGAPRGRFSVSGADIPVSTQTISGALDLGEATIDWRADRGFWLNLTTSTLAAPLTVSGRSLEATGSDISLSAQFGQGDPTFALSMVDAVFTGELIPANLSAGQMNLDLTSAATGLQGRGTLAGVLITDTRQDALYEPMAAQFDARITDGQLAMTGPIRLAAGGEEIAAATLDLDIAALTGIARVSLPGLDFAPGRLQPHQVSERLRGLFTDARGRLSGDAVVRIAGGSLSGQATTNVSGFGFQTLALGRVSGVNGVILFDDLIALTTPPGQTVTVSSIDPGIPLQSGRIQFQLLGPSEARLETATWPFAGGVLRIEPMNWRLGETNRKVTVSAQKVELSALVEALAAKNIEAQGTVSGSFPIEFDGSNGFINGARLTADQKGGVIRYTGNAARQAANTNESVALAFDALENLEYSILEIGADGNTAGTIVVSLKIVGRNPEVLSGTPFNFNIAIDSQLGELLRSSRSLTSSDWLAEAVVKQVNDKGEQP